LSIVPSLSNSTGNLRKFAEIQPAIACKASISLILNCGLRLAVTHSIGLLITIKRVQHQTAAPAVPFHKLPQFDWLASPELAASAIASASTADFWLRHLQCKRIAGV
jgi:hypothetical protein